MVLQQHLRFNLKTLRLLLSVFDPLSHVCFQQLGTQLRFSPHDLVEELRDLEEVARLNHKGSQLEQLQDFLGVVAHDAFIRLLVEHFPVDLLQPVQANGQFVHVRVVIYAFHLEQLDRLLRELFPRPPVDAGFVVLNVRGFLLDDLFNEDPSYLFVPRVEVPVKEEASQEDRGKRDEPAKDLDHRPVPGVPVVVVHGHVRR